MAAAECGLATVRLGSDPVPDTGAKAPTEDEHVSFLYSSYKAQIRTKEILAFRANRYYSK